MSEPTISEATTTTAQAELPPATEELPRTTGSEAVSTDAACPICGTQLAVTTSAYGSTSPGACPVCHPSTTASESTSVRTTGS